MILTKKNNSYFENEWDDDIDYELLIIALLETINDICKCNHLNTEEQLKKYIEMGSVDNYTSDDEKKEIYEKYQSEDFK